MRSHNSLLLVAVVISVIKVPFVNSASLSRHTPYETPALSASGICTNDPWETRCDEGFSYDMSVSPQNCKGNNTSSILHIVPESQVSQP